MTIKNAELCITGYINILTDANGYIGIYKLWPLVLTESKNNAVNRRIQFPPQMLGILSIDLSRGCVPIIYSKIAPVSLNEEVMGDSDLRAELLPQRAMSDSVCCSSVVEGGELPERCRTGHVWICKPREFSCWALLRYEQTLVLVDFCFPDCIHTEGYKFCIRFDTLFTFSVVWLVVEVGR